MDSQYRGKSRNKAQKENGKILLHGNDGAELKRVKKIDDGRGWVAFELIFWRGGFNGIFKYGPRYKRRV